MRWQEKYGPWAVVTGASDGIGREIANELATRGLNLVLVARRAELLEKIGRELASSRGVKTATVIADLGDQAGIDRLFAATEHVSVGLLAAVAGFGTSGTFIDLDIKQELNMVDVNCRAVVALSHHYARRFAAQRRGGLVLMSSLVAFQGTPKAATYAATKSFIQTFAEGLRVELAPLGVDVLASAPGPVHSGFGARANMKMGMAVSAATVARGTVAALGQKGTVRPGFLSKFLDASLSLLPRRGRARIMGTVMGGMTKHQHGRSTVKA